MSLHLLQEKLARHQGYLSQDETNPHLVVSVGLLQAQVLHHQQKSDEAIAVLEALIPHHKANADLAGYLGLLYFDAHHEERATFFSHKALALNPHQYEGQLVNLLLRALHLSIQLAEIKSLLADHPEEGRLWFVLGATEMGLLNKLEAEKAFHRVTQMWPEFYDAWISLGWCYLLQHQLQKAEGAYQKALAIDSDLAEAWGGCALIKALRHQIPAATADLLEADSRDPTCFLSSVTRIFVANALSPEDAARQFNTTFPGVASEVNRLLTDIMVLESNGTLH